MRNAMMLLVLAGALLAGCTDGGDHAAGGGDGDGDTPQPEPSGERTIVRFESNKGPFTLELYDDKAPVTTANFARYVLEGFYNGTAFHRIVKGPDAGIEVIQGGGMDQATGEMKPDVRAPIKNEAKSSGLRNVQWTVAMARSTSPDSATSQFFINTKANPGLDPGGFSPDGYAVFATVAEGRDAVQAILATPTSTHREGLRCLPGRESSCPTQDVFIRNATVTERGPAAQQALAAIEADRALLEAPPEITLGLITPGGWRASTPVDHIMVWARNEGGPAEGLAWSLAMADGSPVPEDWNVSFDPPQADLGHAGATATGRFGTDYLDHGFTMATLEAPAGAQGVHEVVFRLGGFETTAELTLAGEAPVSHDGSAVHVEYRGTFQKDGSEFDVGEFDATLGQGDFIAGFDFGLIGLSETEEATLVIPPAFGYGLQGSGTPGRERFHGETLLFEVSITLASSQ